MLQSIPAHGDLFLVEEFKKRCKEGCFTNDDGFGHPVKNKQMETAIRVYPSNFHLLPTIYTHIIWFNK